MSIEKYCSNVVKIGKNYYHTRRVAIFAIFTYCYGKLPPMHIYFSISVIRVYFKHISKHWIFILTAGVLTAWDALERIFGTWWVAPPVVVAFGIILCLFVAGYMSYVDLYSAQTRERNESRQRIAELLRDLEQLKHSIFAIPEITISTNGPSQTLHLHSEARFCLKSIGYLNANGVLLGTDAIDKEGTEIEVPVNQMNLGEVRKVGPHINLYDLSAELILRFSFIQNRRATSHERKYLLYPEFIDVERVGRVQVLRLRG